MVVDGRERGSVIKKLIWKGAEKAGHQKCVISQMEPRARFDFRGQTHKKIF
jgi:hypothetical protein